MKVALLLDSSNAGLAVGLASDHSLIDEASYEAYQRQSELMVQEIDNLLKRNNLSRDDIEWVAATKGPGSYTGVRIALTIAKVTASALGIPLYLMSSLEVQKTPHSPTVCLSNARGKRSYIGVYHDDECLLDDTIMDNNLVLDYLKEHPDYLVSGDTEYLGVEGKKTDILDALANADKESNLSDALGARPIYLKDSSTSSLKVIVRPMNSADVAQVMGIVVASFGEACSEKQLKYDLLENPFSHLLVAMSGPDIIGFIDFLVTFDSATINYIAVSENYRKRGVGTRLLGECVKICRSGEEPAEFLCLEVRESNAEARRFYKKHGFEEITVKKQYYADGENAIYMVRSIIND